MNSVDPGYMNAASGIEKRGSEKGRVGGAECPIAGEDGTGTVLWPIAAGNMGKQACGGC
jgi:hypothetical protein